jgi:serine/threonine-protein kinase
MADHAAPDVTNDTVVDGDWPGPSTVREPSPNEPPAAVRLDEPLPVPQAERYAAQRPLGSGGMGEIQLVHDGIVGRDVALKQLRAVAVRLNPRARSRFEHEARLQGQLEHPAIVPVYDIGVRPDGLPFFTMKRVHGDSLSDVLSRIQKGDAPTIQRYTRRRLLSALSQVCLAAHYAHERGVVHRDIKPANIMLGQYGEVYLLDWGIAKVAGSADLSPTPAAERIPAANASQHTMSGAILGTLRTMSPEQATGTDLDGRADVYSLGAVLFEVLTLDTLHGHGTEYEILWRIVEGIEARPSVRVPEAEVPPELEDICVAATKRNPNDRIQSARVLHERIESYLDGDRDFEARKASSRGHAERAKRELERVIGSDESAETRSGTRDERKRRAKALSEVGKALALDPENRDALRTLVALLTNPPRHVPPEVYEEQKVMWSRHLRRAGLAGAIVYGYISINALTTLTLGVHDWKVFLAAHTLWAGALVASLVTIWRPSYRNLFVAFLFGVGASLWITGVYGPHLMVPALLAVHASLYSMVRHAWLRYTMLFLAGLAWTLSVFGEAVGIFPDIVQFRGGGIFIRSPVIDFPETMTTVYLYAAVLAMILFPAVVIGYLRSSYHAADEQMRLQAWQLRQLVPDEARETMRPPHVETPTL